MAPMATRETRLERGRRKGRTLAARLMSELLTTRQTLNVSQRSLSSELGYSQTTLVRQERLADIDQLSFVEVAAIASLLGLELAASLHPVGDPIRDRGHQALLSRFRGVLAPGIRAVAEAPLPKPGDRRTWDLAIRIATQRVGIEAETRVRDAQWLTRRIRERERDGGMDEVLLVLAETAVNRRLLPDILEALGPRFATSPRLILKALRVGQPIPGSGVLLV